MQNFFRKSLRCLISVNLGLFFLIACISPSPSFPPDPPYFSWLQPIQTNLDLTGKAYFWPSSTGTSVKIQTVLTGATPHQTYQVKIHENGSCLDGGNAAEKIFDPGSSFLKIFSSARGNLGKFKATSNGAGFFETTSSSLSFGKNSSSIAGRSILIHQSDGALVACAVIPLPVKENA